MTLSLRARRPIACRKKTRHEAGGGVAATRIAAGERALRSSASARSNTAHLLRAPACRRTTAIRGVACFIRPSRGSQPCSKAWVASWSMSFPAAIIVEGVPAQLRRRRIWRVQMRDQRRRRVGTGPHGQRRQPRIRRDLSLREGSAFEPQRLPRRRFPLGAPRIVASLMVAPASLAVRCFRPPVACDDRPATTLTADDVRIDDEMVPDPLVDPIALVTDGGEASRIDLVEKVVHLNAPGSSPPRQRRTWRRRHPPCRDGAAAALCGRALELAAKEARARSPR